MSNWVLSTPASIASRIGRRSTAPLRDERPDRGRSARRRNARFAADRVPTPLVSCRAFRWPGTFDRGDPDVLVRLGILVPRVIASNDVTPAMLRDLSKPPFASRPVGSQPFGERRRQPLGQECWHTSPHRQHRGIDIRAGAERRARDRDTEREIPPRDPSCGAQRGRRCCGVLASDIELQDEIGTRRARSGRSRSSPSSSVVTPNGGLATTRYGSLGNRSRRRSVSITRTRASLLPAAKSVRRRSAHTGSGSTAHTVAPVAARVRGQGAAARPEVDDEVVSTQSELADPTIDQCSVNEEVLTVRAPPGVPLGPAQSPGHGPSPSTS